MMDMMIKGYKISNLRSLNNRRALNINIYMIQLYSMITYFQSQTITLIKSITQIIVQTVWDRGEMENLLIRKVVELMLYEIGQGKELKILKE